MYIARHYVRVNGTVYTKGERIPDGIPAEKIEWLLRAEAIEEAPAPASYIVPDEVHDEPAEEPAEVEEEADESIEAPEIDVMAGIVPAGDGEKKSRKAGRRKKSEG